MEEQQIQPLVPEKNNKYPQPLPSVYATAFQEEKNDEWNLSQILAVVRRRAVVIGSVALAISSTVWFSTLSREATYEGKFQLLVEPVTAENQFADLTNNSGTTADSQQAGLDYNTQIQVLQSPKLIAPIIKQISTRYPDITYYSLIANLTITRFQEETKILEVRYQDSNPQKIDFILQQLAKGYLKYSLQERQTNLGQGIQFVASQQPLLQARVNSLQTRLQVFRQKYNFIDPEVKAEQLSSQISNIELQRLDTQKQLAETRKLYTTLQSRSGTVEVLKEAPVYQKLVEQLGEVESQIAAESTKFRQDSPTMQGLRQKRENLLSLLRQEAKKALDNKRVEIATQISGLEVRDAQIARKENSFNQQLKQLPTITRQYTDLQRELKVATESLNLFLQKRQSLQIEAAQKEVPWQLITEPEVPEAPISPNVKRNLILGAIAGLLAGMGAALLVERLDNVFYSSEELKEVTKLPLLGVIPFHKYLKKLAPVAEVAVKERPDGYKLVLRNISNAQNESYFPFLEAFRSLHTNIGFLGSDTPINSFVISSALHAEGKSTVAVQLAQAAAAMGRRVLLVDADLRLPSIHTLLGLPNAQGLSNVISTNLPILKAIQRSPSSDNLFVLTAGHIPPDPTKLLSSKKLKNIMEQIRKQFDLVIYDTPPVLGLADSSLLAPYTDGIVLVVRIGKTERSIVMQALDGLKISRAAILGTVANGVKNYNQTPYSSYYQPRTQSV